MGFWTTSNVVKYDNETMVPLLYTPNYVSYGKQKDLYVKHILCKYCKKGNILEISSCVFCSVSCTITWVVPLQRNCKFMVLYQT